MKGGAYEVKYQSKHLTIFGTKMGDYSTMTANGSALTNYFSEYYITNVEDLKKEFPKGLKGFLSTKEAKPFDVSFKLNQSFKFFRDLKDIEAQYPGFG
jgi:hypothetical protein